MQDVGAWGPTGRGGRGRRWPRLLLAAVLSAGVAAAGATASVASITFDAVTQNIERASVEGLDQVEDGSPLHVLVVGSDAREDLTPEERVALTLGSAGSFGGERSDTVLLVTINADRSSVSLVSFPRDLVVTREDGSLAKLTETYGDGREGLVSAVTEEFGFPVNHYVEVSITGFIETVGVVGGVDVCLDEPLRDPLSGADLEAGCQRLDPEQALSYVRSRQGVFGDFERIERQQLFLRGLVDEVLDGRLLLDPGRLVSVAGDVSENLVVDDGLTVPLLVDLARQMQDSLGDGITMITVPSFPRDIRDAGLVKSFVVPYDPGMDAIVDALETGTEPAPRGTQDERAEIDVQLWVAGRPAAAAVVESTLAAVGFRIAGIAGGPVDVLGDTVVYQLPGFEEQAAWVAAHLGAQVRSLPVGLEPPEGRTVVVAVGADAADVAEDAPPSAG